MPSFANQLKQWFYEKGSAVTPTSSHRLPLLDSAGNAVGSNTLANIAPVLLAAQPTTVDTTYFKRPDVMAAFDNLFIAVTRLSDEFPLLIRPDKWVGTYSNTTNYHTAGIAVVNGGSHGFVVAKDEYNGTKQWGPTGTLVGSAISNRTLAMRDITGQTRTSAIAANSVYSSTDYAAAWCAAYAQTGESTTSGKTAYNLRSAGKWWLPSAGELWMIYQNFRKINQLLTLIESQQSGTTMQLQESAYWSSTEYSAGIAWRLNFSGGGFDRDGKTTTDRVRPVSAL